MRRHMRGQGGYTVIEFMIVLVVLGLLAAAAATTWQRVGESLGVSSAKGAAEQLAEAVRSTRQRAITAASNFCVTTALSGQGFEIRDIATASFNANAACTGGTLVEGPTELLHGGSVSGAWSFTMTPVSTAVNGSGNLIAATAIQVTAQGTPSGSEKRVCVNGAGAVTVLNPGPSCS